MSGVSAEPPGKHSNRENPEVLIVEDEESLRETYRLYIENAEYDVQTATNGGEALVALTPEIDIVLFDRRMPGMSGDEVLEEIASRQLDCRVVMVTAVEPTTADIGLPYDDYLTKPVSKEEMRETIQDLLLFERYESLLLEYHSLTRTYATLKSRGNGTDPEFIEKLTNRREQVQTQLVETTESFTDESVRELFSSFHNF